LEKAYLGTWYTKFSTSFFAVC